MKTNLFCRRVAPVAAVVIIIMAVCAGFNAHVYAGGYNSVNSDSDIMGDAHDTDRRLINPWGLVTGTAGDLRVSDEGSGFSTVYAPLGALVNITGTTHAVTIPQAALHTGTLGLPTGAAENLFELVTSATGDFVISNGTSSGSARFLYCTEDGAIAGYRDTVDVNSAIIGPNSADQSANDAGYTGIALSWAGEPVATAANTTTLAHHLYAANFRVGVVQVFDHTFTLVALSGSDTFTDPSPPAVPVSAPVGATWSPFNIHTLDIPGKNADGKPGTQRRLLVTYALHSGIAPLNDIPGPGYGFVDIYTPDGAFVRRFVDAGGPLNSPWGIAVSHRPLPKLLNAPVVVLVGNHGDGLIHTFGVFPSDPAKDGKPLGELLNDQKIPLGFDGLWALHFGRKKISKEGYNANPGDLFEDFSHLYFSAGIVNEMHGLVGRITFP